MFERLTSRADGRPEFRFNRTVALLGAIYVGVLLAIAGVLRIWFPEWGPSPDGRRIVSIVTPIVILVGVRWIIRPGFPPSTKP